MVQYPWEPDELTATLARRGWFLAALNSLSLTFSKAASG